jgi:hypothetical protein
VIDGALFIFSKTIPRPMSLDDPVVVAKALKVIGILGWFFNLLTLLT